MNNNYDFLENWLSLNLFCNPSLADMVLLDLEKKLKQYNDQTKWYYLRYNYPQNHIKLRIVCSSFPNTNEFINWIKNNLNLKAIWKIQIDSYFPEEFTYRLFPINITENLFCDFSKLSIEIIKRSKGELQRLYSCFLSIKEFLLNCLIDLDLILIYLLKFEAHFDKTYFFNKSLKKDLARKYSEFNQTSVSSENKKIIIDLTLVATSKVNIKRISSENDLKKDLVDFINSHIHLIVNRTMSDFNKVYEAIIYKFLIREFRKERNKINI